MDNELKKDIVAYIPAHPDNKFSTGMAITFSLLSFAKFRLTLVHFLLTRATYPFLVPRHKWARHKWAKWKKETPDRTEKEAKSAKKDMHDGTEA